MYGSCTANAAVGLVEYYENRSFKKFLDASRMFVWKTTHDLMGVTGNTGAYIRTTMESLVLFGTPPERYWPYDAIISTLSPLRSTRRLQKTIKPFNTFGSIRRT